MPGEPKMRSKESVIKFKKFYNLEKYLLDEVRTNFNQRHYLEVDEFFCIVIWKANRSKSKVKKRLQRIHPNINSAVKEITSTLYRRDNPRDKLQYLISQCGFRLPTASAILTILYPENFTVYDVRVCDMLDGFRNLINRTNFDRLWAEYQEFKKQVILAVPEEANLREKDRALWGKSFHDDLTKFLSAAS